MVDKLIGLKPENSVLTCMNCDGTFYAEKLECNYCCYCGQKQFWR